MRFFTSRGYVPERLKKLNFSFIRHLHSRAFGIFATRMHTTSSTISAPSHGLQGLRPPALLHGSARCTRPLRATKIPGCGAQPCPVSTNQYTWLSGQLNSLPQVVHYFTHSGRHQRQISKANMPWRRPAEIKASSTGGGVKGDREVPEGHRPRGTKWRRGYVFRWRLSVTGIGDVSRVTMRRGGRWGCKRSSDAWCLLPLRPSIPGATK